MEEADDGMDRELTKRESVIQMTHGYTNELSDLVNEPFGRLQELINQYYDIDEEMHKIGNQADLDMADIDNQMSEIQSLIQKTR